MLDLPTRDSIPAEALAHRLLLLFFIVRRRAVIICNEDWEKCRPARGGCERVDSPKGNGNSNSSQVEQSRWRASDISGLDVASQRPLCGPSKSASQRVGFWPVAKIALRSAITAYTVVANL